MMKKVTLTLKRKKKVTEMSKTLHEMRFFVTLGATFEALFFLYLSDYQ